MVGGNSHLQGFSYDHYAVVVRDFHEVGKISPLFAVDRNATNPLHKQIYDGFCRAILDRRLHSGQRVPSSREMASELGVSRIPVLNAYAQLLVEGYFESRVGSGTYVSTSLPDRQQAGELLRTHPSQVISGPRPISRRSTQPYVREEAPWTHGWGAFGLHQPAFDQFPFKIWSNIIARHSRNPRAGGIQHIDPLGSERFRSAICAYLRTSRAVRCDPEQIMIVSGSQQALDITARVLFDAGNSIWVENPGYGLARSAFLSAGCRLVPVPVDNEGLDVSAGIRRSPKARAAYVTPSHQYPLGVTMSAARRLQLLNWAHNSGSWIIEDDYDSEYRYESMPIASLQGLDRNSRVIYIGTFSKVLFPSLRIGYIVIPPDLVEPFIRMRFAMDIFPPYLYQEALTEFINEGHFARHLRKMRTLYGQRRTALIQSLQDVPHPKLEVLGSEAGMHLAALLPDGFSDREIALRAADVGLWLWPLSPSYLGKPLRQGFVLGFGSTPSEQLPQAVRRMYSLLSS